MDKLTFFFDRTFGTRLPSVLAKVKPPMRVIWHQEQGFAHDTPDDQWMASAGAAKWVVLSQDRKWHENAAEASAVKQYKLRCFYLPCEDRWKCLNHFVRTHDKMMSLAVKEAAPFIFHLKGNGRLYKVKL